MRTDDLTVEVRDKTLTRLGVIQPEFLDLEGTPRDSAVGEWRLRLPADHPMAPHLRTPGAGIIVTGPTGDPWFSGPMTRAVLEVTYEDQVGVVVVDGVTDEIILWDALAWPDPDFDWSSLNMDFAYDTFTGLPWDLMAYFLNINLPRFGGLLGSLLTIDLSAVDGSGGVPGVNLLPNPDPQDATGWSTDTPGSYSFPTEWVYWISTSLTYVGENRGSWYSGTPSGSPRTESNAWPVADGVDGVPVTPGTVYECTVQAALYPNWGAQIAVGVTWFDSSGDDVSTSVGSGVAPTYEDPGVWMYRSLEEDEPEPNPTYQCAPSGEFTCPAGAAFARPFARVTWTSAVTAGYYLAHFHFGAA